eukprot:m.16505 g.16505  ORF g.16505 m.16505 type:complete len:100 (-) comp8988_c0_seq1:50-349(-)
MAWNDQVTQTDAAGWCVARILVKRFKHGRRGQLFVLDGKFKPLDLVDRGALRKVVGVSDELTLNSDHEHHFNPLQCNSGDFTAQFTFFLKNNDCVFHNF